MKKKQPDIPDINLLADIFLDTLKETKASGNLVNRKTFAQFLARKQSVKDLLKLAREGRNESLRSVKRHEVSAALKVDDEDDTVKEKSVMTQIVAAEFELDRERDFQKRFALFMLNVCREPYGESFGTLLDQYKQLVVDDAAIEERESVFTEFKNTMLKGGFPSASSRPVPGDSQETGEAAARQSIFKRFLGDGPEIKLKALKSNMLKTLEQLQSKLDDAVQVKLAAITDRIRDAEDPDYLLSLGKQVIALFEENTDVMKREQIRLAAFIKDIGKRLIAIESDIIMTFASSNDLLEDDSVFTEKLGNQIRTISTSIDHSDNLDQLKRIISEELSSLAVVLDERKREYDERLEKNTKEKEKLQDYFQSMVSHVIAQNKQLVAQSQKDSLTGVYNRQTFEEMFERERIRYQRYREPFTVVMFDIDRFKTVNDTYGHDAGDRVLRGVARTVLKILRKTDVFARFGGEEFIILMPKTALAEGGLAAEKIRKMIAETEFMYENVIVPITISAGVSAITDDDSDFSTLYNRVDSLLYRAKNDGRNTIKTDTDR